MKRQKQKLKHQSPLNFLLGCQFDGAVGFARAVFCAIKVHLRCNKAIMNQRNCWDIERDVDIVSHVDDIMRRRGL